MKDFLTQVRHISTQIPSEIKNLSYRTPESVRISIAAMLVGLSSGIGVWLFKQLINLFQYLLKDEWGSFLLPLGSWTILFVPILGGLIVGGVAYWFIGNERYHGLSGVIESCALAGGRLPYRKMPVRVAAAALSIGCGASVGPEDPSVQLGANIGSMFSEWFHISEEYGRALVAGGAAAGIAAAFNAPIAGVFFALEVLLGELSSNSFAFAAISSVVSAVFTQAVSGAEPAFSVPQYSLNSIGELLLYLGLGLLAGPVAAIYVRLIHFSGKFFSGMKIAKWLKPALAGSMVGLVLIFLPQLFGTGYNTIEMILAGTSQSLLLIFLLMTAKVILTPISVGGGFYGGVFAPALFIGAALGHVFGGTINLILPNLHIDIPAFALVGMAAVLAGAIHAPLTAILLLFEMTRDYRIILPLMFAVTVSLLISRRLQKESVYQIPLSENGVRLEQGRDVEVLSQLEVREVMGSTPDTLNEDISVQDAIERMSETHHHGMPILDRSGNLTGIVTLHDIDQALEKMKDEEWAVKTSIGQICKRELVTVYPDDSASTALRVMSFQNIGRIPVVDRHDPKKLVGLLRREDLIHAYQIALTHRASKQHNVQQVRLKVLGDVEVHEVRVQPGSSACNKSIAEISWPKSCVISSIRRGHRVILAHGDSLIQEGDVLAVVVEADGLKKTRELCQGPGQP